MKKKIQKNELEALYSEKLKVASKLDKLINKRKHK